MITDTTFLIDLARHDPGALAKAKTLESAGELLRVPAPALYELWEGIERSRHPARELASVEALLEDFFLLPLEPRHAKRAGTVSGVLTRKGTPVDDIDLLLAGMALEEDLPILTRNLRDFRRVPDLRLETY